LLYRIWPQVIAAMALVKPATVVAWHRKGFRFYWRRRSGRPGRPRINPEIRNLIRRMSNANPLWGAPRIHRELLKLGIKISQATSGGGCRGGPNASSKAVTSLVMSCGAKERC
jgi:putative transposase